MPTSKSMLRKAVVTTVCVSVALWLLLPPAGDVGLLIHPDAPLVRDAHTDSPIADDPPSKSVRSDPAAAQPQCNAGDRRDWRPGKCADDRAWLLPWMAARPHGDWTLVDVGANKGYVISDWLDTLLPPGTHRFGSEQLGVGIFRRYGGQLHALAFNGLCGGCCECVDQPPTTPTAHRAKSVKIYAYEPSVANYGWLSSFFTNSSLVSLRNAAVATTTGKAYFPDVTFGTEIGKVLAEPREGYRKVDIVSLDQDLSHLKWIDVLATDAEGFDQEVAKGARGFLSQARVGVYQFEMYKETNYTAVFDRLDRWGYTCYFTTSARKLKGSRRVPRVPELIRITGCWEDAHNRMYTGWVNGLCHNRAVAPLATTFARLAKQHHQRKSSGNCDGRQIQIRLIQKFLRKHSISFAKSDAGDATKRDVDHDAKPDAPKEEAKEATEAPKARKDQEED